MKASFQVAAKNLYYVGNLTAILVSDLKFSLPVRTLNLMQNVDKFC